MLTCLRTKAVKNLFLSCEEVLSFLFCDNSVTDGATDKEVTVAVNLLEEVLTGIALAGHFDSPSTDRATALQVTGRKCQLHFSFFDDELSRKGLSFFVLHLEFARLTGFQQRLHVCLGDDGSVILSEHDELAVVPRPVGILP